MKPIQQLLYEMHYYYKRAAFSIGVAGILQIGNLCQHAYLKHRLELLAPYRFKLTIETKNFSDRISLCRSSPIESINFNHSQNSTRKCHHFLAVVYFYTHFTLTQIAALLSFKARHNASRCVIGGAVAVPRLTQQRAKYNHYLHFASVSNVVYNIIVSCAGLVRWRWWILSTRPLLDGFSMFRLHCQSSVVGLGTLCPSGPFIAATIL